VWYYSTAKETNQMKRSFILLLSAILWACPKAFGDALTSATTSLSWVDDTGLSQNRSLTDVKPPGALTSSEGDTKTFNAANGTFTENVTAAARSILIPGEIPLLSVSGSVNNTASIPGPLTNPVGAAASAAGTATAVDSLVVVTGPTSGSYQYVFTLDGSLSGSASSTDPFDSYGAFVLFRVMLGTNIVGGYGTLLTNGLGSQATGQQIEVDVPYVEGVADDVTWYLQAGGHCSFEIAGPGSSGSCMQTADYAHTLELTSFKVLDASGQPATNAVLQTSSGFNYLALPSTTTVPEPSAFLPTGFIAICFMFCLNKPRTGPRKRQIGFL
jgi:hypothetical protein